MAPEIVRPDGGDATPDPSREVEFALMLSRVINSVEKNPEFLRATVYELARHKLKEEFTSESFGDIRNLSKSLETAIAGVEAFSKKKMASRYWERTPLRGRRSYRPIHRTNMLRPLSSRFLLCSKPMSSDLVGHQLGKDLLD